jgi:putative copper resistance protein D
VDTPLVIARFLHYASSLLMLGEIVFAAVIAGAMSHNGGGQSTPNARYQRLVRVGGVALVVSVVSGALWFVVKAVEMSGLSLQDTMHRETLSRVLLETTFGRVWLLRGALSIGIGALLFGRARVREATMAHGIAFALLSLGGAYVGALAWAGHAAGGQGVRGGIQLLADVVHLVAASAWLGALPALVSALRRAASRQAVALVHRFSAVGIVMVSALALTGIFNAWVLVGSISALLETPYGCTLCAKLALFGLMVALALVNRLRLTPRLGVADGSRRALTRNATIEAAAGVGVVALVAVLGIMVPAVHHLHQHHHAAAPTREPPHHEHGPPAASPLRPASATAGASWPSA